MASREEKLVEKQIEDVEELLDLQRAMMKTIVEFKKQLTADAREYQKAFERVGNNVDALQERLDAFEWDPDLPLLAAPDAEFGASEVEDIFEEIVKIVSPIGIEIRDNLDELDELLAAVKQGPVEEEDD